MPIYEFNCASTLCPTRGRTVEHYLQRYESPDPECPCGSALVRREASRFAVVFTGPLSGKYLDRGIEGGDQAKDGGHWAYKTKTLSGKPEPVYIESFDDQRRFCREEGLSLPQDTGFGTIAQDGKGFNPMTQSEAKDMIDQANHAPAADQA